MARYFEQRGQVLTVPYNTLFMEAANEAGVPDLFLNVRKISDPEDRNISFAREVKRAAEGIIYKLQELRINM